MSLRQRLTGDRPIQASSHVHFFEVNGALSFDRNNAFGMRLNIPAGTAARFEPGEEYRVVLIELRGERHGHGIQEPTNRTRRDPRPG